MRSTDVLIIKTTDVDSLVTMSNYTLAQLVGWIKETFSKAFLFLLTKATKNVWFAFLLWFGSNGYLFLNLVWLCS